MSTSGLAKYLIKEGILSKSEYQLITKDHGGRGPTFAKVVVAMGLLNEMELATYIVAKTKLPFIKDKQIPVDKNTAGAIDLPLIEMLEVVPISLDNKTLTVALADPLDRHIMQQLGFFTPYRIKPAVATLSCILATLRNLIKNHSPSYTHLEKFLRSRALTVVPKKAATGPVRPAAAAAQVKVPAAGSPPPVATDNAAAEGSDLGLETPAVSDANLDEFDAFPESGLPDADLGGLEDSSAGGGESAASAASDVLFDDNTPLPDEPGEAPNAEAGAALLFGDEPQAEGSESAAAQDSDALFGDDSSALTAVGAEEADLDLGGSALPSADLAREDASALGEEMAESDSPDLAISGEGEAPSDELAASDGEDTSSNAGTDLAEVDLGAEQMSDPDLGTDLSDASPPDDLDLGEEPSAPVDDLALAADPVGAVTEPGFDPVAEPEIALESSPEVDPLAETDAEIIDSGSMTDEINNELAAAAGETVSAEAELEPGSEGLDLVGVPEVSDSAGDSADEMSTEPDELSFDIDEQVAPADLGTGFLNHALVMTNMAGSADQALRAASQGLIKAGVMRGVIFILGETSSSFLAQWSESGDEFDPEVAEEITMDLKPEIEGTWEPVPSMPAGLGSLREDGTEVAMSWLRTDEQADVLTIAGWQESALHSPTVRELSSAVIKALVQQLVPVSER